MISIIRRCPTRVNVVKLYMLISEQDNRASLGFGMQSKYQNTTVDTKNEMR